MPMNPYDTSNTALHQNEMINLANADGLNFHSDGNHSDTRYGYETGGRNKNKPKHGVSDNESVHNTEGN